MLLGCKSRFGWVLFHEIGTKFSRFIMSIWVLCNPFSYVNISGTWVLFCTIMFWICSIHILVHPPICVPKVRKRTNLSFRHYTILIDTLILSKGTYIFFQIAKSFPAKYRIFLSLDALTFWYLCQKFAQSIYLYCYGLIL